MSSLFGSNTTQQNQNQNPSTGTSLFGNNTTSTQNQGSSLFGSNTTQNNAASSNTGSSLFGGGAGNAPAQPNQGGTSMFRRDSIVAVPTLNTGGSLFGGNNSTAQNQPQGTSLFGGGAAAAQNQQQGTGLFGASTNTQSQPQGTGLFGTSNPAQNQPQGTGLFGVGASNQNQPQGTSLFGGNTQSQPQGTSLFGASTTAQNQPQGIGLFGASQPSQNQTQPQGTGLFSTNTNTQPQGTGLFSNPNPLFAPTVPNHTTHPQQTHLSTLLQTGLGAHAPLGALGTTAQQDLARARLAEANIATNPNTPPVFSQIQTLIRKWDPNSTTTILQSYLYNAVNAAYAPFYHRNADEDPEAWEAALAAKPKPLEDKTPGEASNISFVPVLVRGFHALGQRAEYQARTVNEMRARLHEMQNSLDAVMARHRQGLSVRLENARRQHAALAQRCLRLAVKAQVLRQRNYPLDAGEEGLRRVLGELEGKVLDPGFRAREEEVWARLVVLRERARWLEEEGRRVGQLQQQVVQEEGKGGGVSEEVLGKTRRILRDYDGQIGLLARELEEVKKEFEEFEGRKGR